MSDLELAEPTHSNEFKDSGYELFILALSLLSLFNFVATFLVKDVNVQRVILAMDMLLSLIFLGDFLFRLFTAESKRRYFIRQYGWLDLVSSLPFPRVKIARLGRVLRAVRLMREYGLRNMLREFFLDRAGSAILIVLLLIILVLEFASIAILAVEINASSSNIHTASDALWWTIVTVSTVGYGDQYPTTPTGRIIGIIVIVIGVGLFGVLTGYLANRFLVPASGDEGSTDFVDPSDVKFAEILNELRHIKETQTRHEAELLDRIAELETRLSPPNNSAT